MGLICNSFSVMTVCNLPLWEYSGDSPGTRGHKRPCLGTLDTRVPINTPVQCLERPDEQSNCHPTLNFACTLFTSPLDPLAQESKFQHFAPTVRATNKPPAMAPKRASSKAAPSIDDTAKAALLAEKKRKSPRR
jgi:hypothetical protein